MSTWNSYLSGTSTELAVWLTIEGVGPALSTAQLVSASLDDRYRFCIEPPVFASSEPAGLWKPLIEAPPTITSERISKNGGFVELGGVSFTLLDEDDVISSLLNPDSIPITRLSVKGDNGLAIEVVNTAQISNNQVLFIGNEAVTTEGAAIGNYIPCRRGTLGTKFTIHDEGAPVYAYSPYLRDREVRVYVGPLNATSSAESQLVGIYRLTGLTLDDTTALFTFSARSHLFGVEASTPFAPRSLKIANLGSVADKQPGRVAFDKTNDLVFFNHWNSSAGEPALFAQMGKEVVAATFFDSGTLSLNVSQRGVAKTELVSPKIGDSVRQVYVANEFGSSFRYSPGPNASTSRSSGTWIQTTHPLEILLCILMSKTNEGSLNNFQGGRNNYGSLPAGAGLGVDWFNIDLESFENVIRRTRSIRMPNLVYGGKEEKFNSWANKNILEPLNCSIILRNGKLYCHRPRPPISEEEVFTIDNENILIQGSEEQGYLPEVSLKRNFLSNVNALKMNLGSAGDRYEVSVRATRAGPSGEEKTIDVAGAEAVDAFSWEYEAASRIRALFKPKTEASVLLDPEVWSVDLGDYVRFRLSGAPNFSGSRDIDCLAQMTERQIELSVEDGLVVNATLTLYQGNNLVSKRISPALEVVSVESPNYTCVVEANRFTATSSLAGYPTNDLAPFAVNDTLQLRNASGVPQSGLATILSISGSSVRIDSNFSGALNSGTVLVRADHSNAAASVQSRYAYLGGDSYFLNSGTLDVYGGF